MSPTALLLTLSSAVQIAAAIVALRLIRVTGRRRAWVLVSTGLLLMVLRRLLSLAAELGAGADLVAGGFLTEAVSLGSSVILLIGVSWIGWVFRQGQADAHKALRLSEELGRHRDHLEEVVRERTATLLESEGRFRALAESSVDVIMRFDGDCRHLYANPVVESQTGIPAARFIGKTHAEMGFPAELVELWEGAIRQVFATGRPNRVEFSLPSGIWIDWLLIPELRPDDGVRTVITTARDITERKSAERELTRHRDHLEELVKERTAELEREIAERVRTEQALRASEERFRSLYDNVVIGLYRTTPEGRILMANPALARMLGYGSSTDLESVDLNADGTWRGLTRSEFRRLMEEKGEALGLEYPIRRPDGTTMFLREHARSVSGPDGTVLYCEGTLEDVTEQRALEEQLRQAQRMEAIGHLAGGIAHDFNNFLMAVMGSVELLERRLGDDTSARKEIGIIQRSVQRAGELIRGLLAFARRQVLTATPLDLDQVVRELVPMLRRMIPENIAIEFLPGAVPLWVEADRANLDQVLMNLAVNSRDAMPSGGTISIRTDRVTRSVEELTAHPWAVPGEYAELSFADSGAGMDPLTLAHVFDPFFTTKEPGKGTGMGLATAYGIVRQHGGIILAESEPGRGTTLVMSLPLVEPRPEVSLSRPEATAGGGSETILVAEDDPEVRAILVDVLGGLGYRVLAAADGGEALELLARHEAPVDLVLTDLIMPRMGGSELFEAARKLAPRVRFLFSSGYADGPAHDALLAREDVTFIAKPFRIDNLARKVREVLDSPAPSEPAES